MFDLILVHTRYQFLEQLRVPIALVASAFFPAAAMLALVVPFAGSDPASATSATAGMMLFGAMSAALIGLSINVAQDREQPWDPYLRTLPAGPLPRFAGRILTTMAGMLLSVVPVLLISAFLTAAAISPLRLALGIGALLVGSVPFMLLGLFIGYAASPKAAIAVSQVAYFPIAALGGLLVPLEVMPGFVQSLAPFVPSRGAIELMWAAVAGRTPSPVSLAAFAGWIVLAAAAAAWAYRRDEGRRFS
ncbi:ABC transporter permease [Nonomuraea sp. SBT364]|uniref:ABC transporter permease n=1 Tax=Nonomuraea sp. SBT364 TaxID=1580530 RepID=UPI00066BDE17|nr:ABC transporter permease [Nonomuraea sp. SBT364]